ncbi:fimbrial protein [Serratia fonticola]|uniref:fimbrial protein n=1 Tax=Serratia fonticola TaxID=47917 RepID=UPI000E0EAD69|nr:fimbrial protein [Serratia fonticola]RDL14118.1 type 1 fimbria pilin [Serratia fonticola]
MLVITAKKMLRLGLAVISIIFSQQSLAASCHFNKASKIQSLVNLPASLTVGRDTAPGTILWDSGWINGATSDLYCDGASFTSLGYVSPMTLAPGYSDVYQTSNSTIGIRTSFANTPFLGQRIRTVDYPARAEAFDAGPGMKYIPSSSYRVQLVALGALQSGPVSFPSPTAQLTYTNTVTNELTLSATDINVRAASCSINNSSITIPLDTVYTSELTAIGTTLKTKAFNIGLNCTAGTKVYIRLIGTQDPDTLYTGVLKLSNAGTAGVATGVGIMIKYNNLPIAMNGIVDPTRPVITSTGGAEILPFTAAYLQTKATATTGTANATATIDVTYQ